MKVDDIKDYFGTFRRAAKCLGITYVSIEMWRKNGIPEQRQYQLNYITKGRLKLDEKYKKTYLSAKEIDALHCN